ncbi:hypothetical protein LCGC14_1283010 [marine sediment metagenome]|uniref:Uncharacterized protein n=1 Tax=marine sediment metagenome TaxID=412755 RepID=A0A0F9NXR9_9ZZZZ
MYIMRKLIPIILLGILLLPIGCMPPKFITKEPIDVKFDPTPPYSIDLSKIPKPDKLKPIFVDENLKEVPMEKAKFILLSPVEYRKIAALLKLAKAYKGIVKEQEILVNTHVDIINSLKEYIALERAKAKEYRQLWADSENAYRQEKYAHSLDNAINKGAFGLMSIGSLVLMFLLL